MFGRSVDTYSSRFHLLLQSTDSWYFPLNKLALHVAVLLLPLGFMPPQFAFLPAYYTTSNQKLEVDGKGGEGVVGLGTYNTLTP